MRLDRQIFLKSPPPLTLLAVSSPVEASLTLSSQNRRPEVFTREALSSWGCFVFVPWGLNIKNLIKPPMIYSVSYFDLGRIGTLFEGISPPKPPVATRLYRASSIGLPVLASRRLSSSVSSAIRFLILDLTCFILKTALLPTYVFQTSSAFILQNLSVSEIYLCWLISRSSLQSGLTPLVLCIVIEKCYACSN